VTPQFFADPEAPRAWFVAHADEGGELLLGYWKTGTGRPSVTWPESVDEALCVGWIDGVRRRIDDESYVIRFTPRRPGRTWSAADPALTRAVGVGAYGPACDDRPDCPECLAVPRARAAAVHPAPGPARRPGRAVRA
jgi:hypothetical protein